MGEGIGPRDQAYLDILHYGLVSIRNFAHGDRIDLCRVEAEHLHNVPTLIGESNERRHLHYLRCARELYLEQLRELGAADAADYLEQVAWWYTNAWKALASAAGVQLDEFM